MNARSAPPFQGGLPFLCLTSKVRGDALWRDILLDRGQQAAYPTQGYLALSPMQELRYLFASVVCHGLAECILLWRHILL